MLYNIIMIILKAISFIALWVVAEMTIDDFKRIYKKRRNENNA